MEQAVLAEGGFGILFLQVIFNLLLLSACLFAITYFFGRLTLEYARLMSLDRESMSYNV